MIDPKKLNSQLDLKNMDAEQLTKLLIQYQNPLIKVALIVGSLLIVGMLFNDHRVKDQGLRVQMSGATQKLEVMKGRDAAVGNLNDFKSSLPKKINEFELVTLISDYAKLYNINFSSLSPAESKNMGLYDAIIVNCNAVSDNFKDMTLFIRKIERSNYPLRIDKWFGQKESDGKIDFTIIISAVLVHTT